MHCFIGLSVQNPLHNAVLDLTHNWDKLALPPADFHKHTYPHVTIVPPFDIKAVNKLISDLRVITNNFPAFDADYSEINAFNHRILHVAVESNGLIDLRVKLFEAGHGNFRYQEEHPIYRPHVTIAYVRDPLTSDEFSALKQQLQSRLALPEHQQITHIQVFGRERPGMDYRTLADLPLSGSY